MLLNYVITPSGNKLFSFQRHDYKIEDGVFIDGGVHYTRTNSNIYRDDIATLIGDIREQFVWGRNYNADGTLLAQTEYKILKDLTTEHIIAILIYFTRNLKPETVMTKEWILYHLIFLNELKYRHENKLE